MKQLLCLILLISLPILTFADDNTYSIKVETTLMENQSLVWNGFLSLITKEGEPAQFQLNGNNFKILIQMSCYPVEEDLMLVVQTEVLMMENGQVSFYTDRDIHRLSSPFQYQYYPLGGRDDMERDERFLIINMGIQDITPTISMVDDEE